MSWQTNFQGATTSVAFQLQLSKNMVLMLADIECYPAHGAMNYVDAYYVSRAHLIAGGVLRDVWVTTADALKRRGLIEHHPKPERADKLGHVWFTLTPAGVHVLALCRLAGLIPDLSAAPANSEAVA